MDSWHYECGQRELKICTCLHVDYQDDYFSQFPDFSFSPPSIYFPFLIFFLLLNSFLFPFPLSFNIYSPLLSNYFSYNNCFPFPIFTFCAYFSSRPLPSSFSQALEYMKHGEGQSLQYRSCGHSSFPRRRNIHLLVWWFLSSSYEQIPPTNKSQSGNCTKYHTLYYLLTPWCTVLLEKLTCLQLVKKFPAFHGTRRFITALTSFRHLSLSWANPFQSIYPHPTSWISILILSTHLRLGLPSGLFPSGFPTKTLYTPSPHPYAPHAQPISFLSILLPAQYWVRSTNHLAPRYAISSIPPLPRPS